jgi:hypothetical protein
MSLSYITCDILAEVSLKNRKHEVGELDMEVAIEALRLFERICDNRGIPSEERDELWQTVTILCAHQLRHRYGTFYEHVKEILLQ